MSSNLVRFSLLVFVIIGVDVCTDNSEFSDYLFVILMLFLLATSIFIPRKRPDIFNKFILKAQAVKLEDLPEPIRAMIRPDFYDSIWITDDVWMKVPYICQKQLTFPRIYIENPSWFSHQIGFWNANSNDQAYSKHLYLKLVGLYMGPVILFGLIFSLLEHLASSQNRIFLVLTLAIRVLAFFAVLFVGPWLVARYCKWLHLRRLSLYVQQEKIALEEIRGFAKYLGLFPKKFDLRKLDQPETPLLAGRLMVRQFSVLAVLFVSALALSFSLGPAPKRLNKMVPAAHAPPAAGARVSGAVFAE